MKKIYFIGLIALAAIVLLSGCPGPPEPEACTEEWSCSAWTDCVNDQQFRSCIDSESCGTILYKPAESQTCVSEPPIDLCEDVSCPDKCEGTTRMTSGSCLEGECRYTATEKSTECGYSEAELDLNTIFRFCEYSSFEDDIDFFYTIRTLGEKNPSPNGTIWLVTNNPEFNKSKRPIERQYVYNDILWGTMDWSGIEFRGNLWTINKLDKFEDFNYQLIYCELNNPFREECTPENGIVLHSGNTIVDCTEED